MGGHVLGVRHRRRDLPVLPRGILTEVRDGWCVVGVDQVVREPRVIRMALEVSFEDRACPALAFERAVGRKRIRRY
jgi:hypothetical protein